MKTIIFFVVLLQVLVATIDGVLGADQNGFCNSILFLRIVSMFIEHELKFPRECGYTPFHARPQIFYGSVVQPDEYSWMASLQYKNPKNNFSCSGSVINSRYVLTAAHCLTGDDYDEAGGLIGVRLGEFYKNGTIKCDYGSSNCRHYQLFGIENIKLHEEFLRKWFTIDYDIALIRVNRVIQFGRIWPICMPFNYVHLKAPDANTSMIVAGWGTTLEQNEIRAKRDAAITLWDTNRCKQNSLKLCAVGYKSAACNGDSGGPLMYQFEPHKMVLEGIVSYGNMFNCSNTKIPGVFTQVRSYFNWLDSNINIRYLT